MSKHQVNSCASFILDSLDSLQIQYNFAVELLSMDTALIIIDDVTVAPGQVLSQKLKHIRARRRDMVHRPIEGFYRTDPARSCSTTLQIDRFMSSFSTFKIFNQHT